MIELTYLQGLREEIDNLLEDDFPYDAAFQKGILQLEERLRQLEQFLPTSVNLAGRLSPA